MLGKILGAVIGAKAARSQPGGVEGPGGALLGIGAMALLRRFGPIGFIAAAAGGYAIKRYQDRHQPAAPFNSLMVGRHRL